MRARTRISDMSSTAVNKSPMLIRVMCWSAIVLAVIWVVLPVIAQMRETPINGTPKSRAASHLKHLAKALYMYADDNGGQFPAGAASPAESLWLLFPKYVADAHNFLNPRSRIRWPRPNDWTKGGPIPSDWIASTGFTYREGLGIKDAAAEPVLCERDAFEGYRFVMFDDGGTIQEMPEEDFQKRLKASSATIAKGRLNAAPAAATPPSSNP